MAMLFENITGVLAQILEGIAVLFIAFGGFVTAFRSVLPLIRGQLSPSFLREAWLGFARWLLLGLEFTMAADIVRTAISPTWDSIGQLAAIAVIRTFLSYFLEHDLEKAKET